VVTPEDADWLAKMTASSVDAVLCDADPVTAGEVIAALREAGWEGALLGGPGLAAADFAAVAGEAAAGAVFVTPYPFPADATGSEDFVVAYRALSPHVPPPGPLALPAYEATWVLLEALAQDIAAHDEPTREGVAAALAEMERGDVTLYWYRVDAQGARLLMPD
jgi:ABC-type branched-subunit amino acid transport system substrate-binding protein